MQIGTLTTGAAVKTTIDLTYLPSVIHYDAGTQLSSLKVTVLGDGVVCDLDANGLDIIGKANRVTSDVGQTVIPLADGFVKGKNVTIELTNSAAQTPAIYAYSQKRAASIYMRQLQQKIFQSSQADFNDFMSLYIPDFDAADEMNIEYSDGFVQKMAPEDLRVINSFDAQINDSDDDFYVNNINQRVRNVSVIAAADRQAYMTRYSRIGNQ
jgi:hypothetical protein